MARKLKAIESKALPKGGNSILNNAKYSSANTDEWYTTYETIAERLWKKWKKNLTQVKSMNW